MSDDKKLDARKAYGSHVSTLELLLKKREEKVQEAVDLTVRCNETYRKLLECTKVDRALPGVIAPGRRADVTATLPVLLDEHPPRDFSTLTAVVERETRAREAHNHQMAAAVIARQGPTTLATEGPVPFGNL